MGNQPGHNTAPGITWGFSFSGSKKLDRKHWLARRSHRSEYCLHAFYMQYVNQKTSGCTREASERTEWVATSPFVDEQAGVLASFRGVLASSQTLTRFVEFRNQERLLPLCTKDVCICYGYEWGGENSLPAHKTFLQNSPLLLVPSIPYVYDIRNSAIDRWLFGSVPNVLGHLNVQNVCQACIELGFSGFPVSFLVPFPERLDNPLWCFCMVVTSTHLTFNPGAQFLGSTSSIISSLSSRMH